MSELTTFTCPSCGAQLRAPADAAGKTGRCTKCKNEFVVPAQFENLTASAPPTKAPASEAESHVNPMFYRPKAPAPAPGAALRKAIVAGIAVAVIAGIALGAWSLLADANDHASSRAAANDRAATQTPRSSEPTVEPSATALVAAPLVAPATPVSAPSPTPLQPSADSKPATLVDAGSKPLPAVRKSIADLVETYGASVVVVKTEHGNGAGFLCFPDNLVVTNYHVIRGGRQITVDFLGDAKGVGRDSDTATVLAVDRDNDLALLVVRAHAAVKALDLGEDGAMRSGTEVFAVGNPGLGGTILTRTVSNGIISSTDRELDGHHYLQTTTAINPGNSGGPLFDMEGRVIGVVSAKATQQENIGFAVAAAYVKALYAEREGRFKVGDDFVKWENDLPFDTLKNQSNTIPINAVATDLVLDAEHNRLIALAPERNKVLFISLAEHKIVKEVFTGTDPSDIQLNGKGQAWVANRTSKSVVCVNLATMLVEKSISLVHAPIAIALARDAIWFLDEKGQAGLVRYTGSDEGEAPVNVRSIAYNGTRNNILCGSTTSWLCELDGDRMVTVIARLKALRANIEDFNKKVDYADAASAQARRNTLLKDISDHEALLNKSIKVYNQPAGTATDFTNTRQSLFIDVAHGRVYFNRCATDSKDPSRILGVFKSPEHTLQKSDKLREFFKNYPYLNQIRAVSPDGGIAASGVHLYNTEDFTVYDELPVPTTAVVFAADNRTLYFSDPVNLQVVGYDFRPKGWVPPPPPAPVKKPGAK